MNRSLTWMPFFTSNKSNRGRCSSIFAWLLILLWAGGARMARGADAERAVRARGASVPRGVAAAFADCDGASYCQLKHSLDEAVQALCQLVELLKHERQPDTRNRAIPRPVDIRLDKRAAQPSPSVSKAAFKLVDPPRPSLAPLPSRRAERQETPSVLIERIDRAASEARIMFLPNINVDEQ